MPYISAPVAQKHACKSGSLSKRASSDPHWDMRWFVLTDTRLFYYKSETSLYPQGAVVLSECERVVQETVPERSNCFALHTSNRKLLLQAQSNEVCNSVPKILKQLAGNDFLDCCNLTDYQHFSLVCCAFVASCSSCS